MGKKREYYHEAVEIIEELEKLMDDAYNNLEEKKFNSLNKSIDERIYEYLGYTLVD